MPWEETESCCDVCNGSGTKDYEKECRECSGSGSVTDVDAQFNIIWNSKLPIRDKSSYISGLKKTCPECDGKGFQTTQGGCYPCGGSGVRKWRRWAYESLSSEAQEFANSRDSGAIASGDVERIERALRGTIWGNIARNNDNDEIQEWRPSR